MPNARIHAAQLLGGVFLIALLFRTGCPMEAGFQKCDPAKLTTYSYKSFQIISLPGEPPNFRFTAGMAIDADGAPNAYHPKNIKDALDYLSSAGKPGNWWALVTDNDKPHGRPVIQGPDDPFPGYYISTTSLEDVTKPRADPKRYVDSTVVPYFVLPKKLAQKFRAQVGDFGAVIKREQRGGEKVVFAIYADLGPPRKLGEGSIALAKALGVPSSPKTGGSHGHIDYIVFPGSGNGKPRSVHEINIEAASLLRSYKQLWEKVCAQ